MDEPPPFGLPLPCLGYGGCSAEVIIDYCKIAPYFKRQQHNWTVCFYSHPGEKACRRDLQLHSYAAVMCSDMLHKGCCPRGDACPQSHSVFEYHMHPARFRTKLCTDGDRCRRPFCFFAHGMQQLREPAPIISSTSRPTARRPAAAAAAAATGCSSGGLVHVLSAPPLLGAGRCTAADTTAAVRGLQLRGDSSSSSSAPVRWSLESASMSGSYSSRSSSSFCAGLSPALPSPTATAAPMRTNSGPTAVLLGLMPASGAPFIRMNSMQGSMQGSISSAGPPVALQSQEGSSASSLGSGFSFASSTAAGAMQLERQYSGQMLMSMQSQQQQQQQQYVLQVQQQQQQMLQVQQLESAAGSAMQQLASLKMELQQRQTAHEANLNAQLLAQQLCTTGLPAASSYSAASDAQMMEVHLVQGMTGEGFAGYPANVQQSVLPALQVPMQSLPQPGFVVDGSSFTPAGSSVVGGIAGGIATDMQPAAAAAGGGSMVVLNASLPAGQCYHLVHNVAGSCMVVSEGLTSQQQQQQQQQLVLLSAVPEAAMLPGQAQLLRYNSQGMQ